MRLWVSLFVCQFMKPGLMSPGKVWLLIGFLLTADILQANDSLTQVINQYRQLVKGEDVTKDGINASLQPGRCTWLSVTTDGSTKVRFLPSISVYLNSPSISEDLCNTGDDFQAALARRSWTWRALTCRPTQHRQTQSSPASRRWLITWAWASWMMSSCHLVSRKNHVVCKPKGSRLRKHIPVCSAQFRIFHRFKRRIPQRQTSSKIWSSFFQRHLCAEIREVWKRYCWHIKFLNLASYFCCRAFYFLNSKVFSFSKFNMNNSCRPKAIGPFSSRAL